MRLYLDDALDSNALIGLLQQGAHTVVSPRHVGMRGTVDEDHLSYAASNFLVLLTANAKDFIELHDRWRFQQQRHSGILIVYRENDPVRDMPFHEIARAVSYIEDSGVPLENAWYNLNFWRRREG